MTTAFRTGVAVTVTLVFATGCASERQVSLESFADSASYAIGMNMGASVEQVKDQIQMDKLMRGLTDQAEGREPALTQQQAMTVLRAFAGQVQASQQQHAEEQVAENKQTGDAFRAENAAKAGITTTASGLQYEVLTEGTGPKPKATDMVRVHYRGSLVDGSEFESSFDGDPVTFPLNQVIPGWTEGVQLMNVGSKYRFVLPPELGYGDEGGPGGPGSTLVFEVELVGIDK
jgi:FKBP-type peptidyl-prolyl cis-trans isomerase